jgi:hypothetical protein
MEVLVSILVGVVLMEAYAWLDTLAKWLISRAARQLPKESRDAFTEQWMADLEAMPNSIAKIVFAFRNCTLDIDNISDEICREKFQSTADEFDEFVETRMVLFDQALQRSRAKLQENARPASELISVLNSSLERLECLGKNANDDARNAINHFRAVSPSVAGLFAEYSAQLELNHDRFETLMIPVRESVALAVGINQRIRRRLLDDTPLNSDGKELADLFNEQLQNISNTLDGLKKYRPTQVGSASELFSYIEGSCRRVSGGCSRD